MDYINPSLKLIKEFDESNHYDISGNLKEKDKIRQQEIMKLYPDFKFERIKQKEEEK